MGVTLPTTEGNTRAMEATTLMEIPRELIDTISRDLSDYHVGIVKIKETLRSEDAILLGSGTLVTIDGIHGILTARHVTDEIDGEMGLILTSTVGPMLHNYTIRSDFLRRLAVGIGSIDAEAPDLAMLVLPPVNLGWIKAIKSFYNLSRRTENVLSRALANDMGIWFLGGFADELTTEGAPERGYRKVKVFRGMCPAVRVPRGYAIGQYDYLQLDVPYGGIDEPPGSLGGFSGGGLWQVPINSSKCGNLQPGDPILSGVAFYQSARENNMRSVKCHGRRSIYKSVIDIVGEATT
jgi:hypothetical protein